MGHERIGVLPKSKSWRKIVSQISGSASDSTGIENLAANVIKSVRSRIKRIEKDEGILASFKFLLLLSFSARQREPISFLNQQGINISNIDSPIQLAQAANVWIDTYKQSDEYATFAKGAVIDAISLWLKQNKTNQVSIFATQDSSDTWEKLSTGAGFCEVSRLYFSKLTERYLKYFLEREASANVDNIQARNNFNQHLQDYIQEISKHAFETAKITQSFSAGWYNTHVKETIPSNRDIEGFLSYAFGKINAELLREEQK